MTDAQQLWEGCAGAIQSQVSEATWRTWFAGVHPLGAINGTLVLGVPNALVRERLESRFADLLTETILDVAGSEVIVQFDIVPEQGPTEQRFFEASDAVEAPVSSAPPAAAADEVPVVSDTTQSGAETVFGSYTFEEFVTGSSNHFAHAAALAVAERPARAYNPLFIIGAAGLGKTHLLQSIRYYVSENFPKLHVTYISTESFMNEFVEAIRTNSTGSFKRRYRDSDVLLIDDIQFLEKSESLQEEFFHTFNSLYEASRQIVLTSDRPPGSIATLEDRLRSRFLSGLVADIQPPELETRIAILRSKAAHDKTNPSDDVLHYIASNIKDNIRELEGALIRVTAYASLTGQALTLELAEAVLADVVLGRQPRRITSQMILSTTANHFGFSIEEVCGPSRRRPLVNARQIGMYVFRELTEFSYPAIAREFGGRDHTTVIHAVEKIARLMREKRQIYDQVTELIVEIRNNA